MTYFQTSYIKRILEDNKIVDQSDADRASHVADAPITSSFST